MRNPIQRLTDPSRAARRAVAYNSRYYQDRHKASKGYQQNNWLVGERLLLEMTCGKTVIEIGCGNGQFLREASKIAKSVHGIDWAISPCMDDLPPNVTFSQADLLSEPIPNADVLCSGDVLEHFPEDVLDALIETILLAAPAQYHVIACFDDNHSHLTIKKPDWWLRRFQEIGNREFHCESRYRKRNRIFRRNQVAIIYSPTMGE